MSRSLGDDSYEPIYDQIRGILGEHFENYCFIVMDNKGELFFDYNHLPAGRMLLREMQEEISEENIEIQWEFEDDSDNSEEEE
jgi:sulfur relay (sulfurtransferase) DsrC/TusE family protein